jgi:type I restriction enzyme S subunit
MNNIDMAGRINLSGLNNVVLGQAEAEKQRLRTGDLLFNSTNSKELVGKAGLWRGQMPAVAASNLIRLRLDQAKTVPEYVWAWMNTPYFKQLLFSISRRAVGMANINASELCSMPILIPNLATQRAFAQRLHALEDLALRREESGEHIQRLFSVLLHRAFTGDLTAKWRQAHLRELLPEMEQQARLLNLPSPERN